MPKVCIGHPLHVLRSVIEASNAYVYPDRHYASQVREGFTASRRSADLEGRIGHWAFLDGESCLWFGDAIILRPWNPRHLSVMPVIVGIAARTKASLGRKYNCQAHL